jgi:CubicO group peptidase (beta-lactamase class C family)
MAIPICRRSAREVSFDRLRELFAENFTRRGELGASVSIWRDGAEILSLAAGFRDREKTQPWAATTPVLFWSATKGLSAACALHACEEHHVPLSAPVASLWPAFAAAGKENITIAQVLSHQAGLPILSREASVENYDSVIAALEEEAPHWVPGDGHGYHPRTFGFLLDQIVRRLAGEHLGSYWRRVFAEPLQLDVWIGIDPHLSESVAPVFAARTAPPKGDAFYQAFATSGSFTARAFASPRGLHSVSALNTFDARTTPFGAFGGIGTAQGLGKFYAMLAAGGELEGRHFFSPEAAAVMSETLTQGEDRVLLIDTAFSTGFMRDPVNARRQKTRSIFGPSLRAFGHPGAGGSLAFADPENRLSLAYVMNQMEPGVLPNPKALLLVEALYEELD